LEEERIMSARPGHGGRKLKTASPTNPKIESLSPTSADKLLETSTGSIGSLKPALGAIKREEPVVEANEAPPIKHSDTEPAFEEAEGGHHHPHEPDHEVKESKHDHDDAHAPSPDKKLNFEEATLEELEAMRTNVGAGTEEDVLNAVEMASPMRQKSVTGQNVDKAFFASMSIKRSTELADYPINDPLIVSANTGSSIDVQMMLEEMGSSATRKVTTRDTYGRTPLHIAAMGDSADVVVHLLETYRRSAYSKFSEELYQLEVQREKSESEITRGLKAAGNIYAGSTMRQVPQLKSVEDWFNNEVLRLQRAIEIRVEVNRAKILATKDKFGRTPMHYAAASGAPTAVVKALLTAGSANLNGKGVGKRKFSLSSSTRGHGSPTRRSMSSSSSGGGSDWSGSENRWFDPDAVYETANGTEIAAVAGSSSAVTGAGGAGGLRSSVDVGVSKYPSMTTSLRNVAWELSGQDGDASGTTMEEDKQQVFEIMIPWVLRNLMRRVTELGSRESTSGITELEHMIEKHCYQPATCLIVPELKKLLGKLGIQVTREVLRELCKRYAAESGSISDKWGVVEEAQKQEVECARRQAEEKARLKKLYGSDFKHGMVDAKGDWQAEGKQSSGGGAGGSKSDEKAGGGSSSPRAESKDGAGGDDGADAKGSSSGGGAKEGSGDEALDELLNDTRAATERMLELERLDADCGLDLHLLITDIKNGRAFQPLFMTKEAEAERSLNASLSSSTNFSSSLNKGIDTFCDGDEKRIKEMSELLDGEGQAPTGAAKTSTQAKVDMDHFQGARSFSHTNTHCAFELPACVSVASISRARKSLLDITDSFGRTPLLIASALGHRETVDALVTAGADVSIGTSEGHNALSLAQGHGIHSILEKALLCWLNDRSSLNALGMGKRLIDKKEFARTSKDGSSSGEMQSTIAAMTSLGTTDKTLLGTGNQSMETRSKVVMGMRSHLKQLGLSKWSYSRNPLSWAVNNGLTLVVKALLEEKEPVDQVDAVGRTALHECATLVREGKSAVLLEESVKIAELLFAAGADPNKGSVSMRTPLHELFCRGQDDASASFTRLPGGKASYYVTEGSADPILKAKFKRVMVRTMLQWGADALAHDRHGMGPLHYCAREDAAGCMVEMLRAGVDGGALSGHSKSTPLHVACKAGASRVGNLLCRWEADTAPGKSLLDLRDGSGKLAIQLLPNSTSPRCLDTLWTLAYRGNLQRVSEILNNMKMKGDARWEDIAEQEYEPEQPEPEADSIEEQGSESKDGESCSAEKKANVDREDLQYVQKDYQDDEAKYGESHKAARNPLDWTPRELWLLDGVDAKSRRQRWSALHACVVGWADAQARGVGYSALRIPGNNKSNQQPKFNACARTALMRGSIPSQKEVRHLGSAQLHKEVLIFLLSSSAFVDAVDTRCRTPLMIAASTNVTDAVEILLAQGADVAAHDLDGNTPLHLAYAMGAASAIVALEAAGADQEAKNHKGCIPLELAGRSSNIQII
jgi:ankyrin repeat protein